MEKIFVNPSWTFRECKCNIRALKSQYQEVLMSFSFLKNVKEETKFIRETRNSVYSLPYDQWRIDKIWEYMNDDLDYFDLISVR